jgi:hypothetical protein
MANQDNWRFCTKCYSLFWYGNPESNGTCPAGQGHTPFTEQSPTHAATSWNFALQIASTEPPAPAPGGGPGPSPAGTQGNWRFCTRCYSLFWYGYPTAGTCPVSLGGDVVNHSPKAEDGVGGVGDSWDFALQIASTDPPAPAPGGGPGPSPAGTQGNWRFCTNCYSLFWYGYPTAGACTFLPQHTPFAEQASSPAGTSWNFALEIASTDPPERKAPFA